MRKIQVYLNSLDEIEFEDNTTWGELKKYLVYNKNYPSAVKALDDNSNIYSNDADKLPDGNLSLTLIIEKTNYGI